MTDPAMWQDYEWTEDHYLFFGLCISVAVPATISSVVADMPTVAATQQRAFNELDSNIWPDAPVAHDTVGLVEHDGAVVLLELESGLGEYDEFMVPISRGRTAVSYYIGGHGRGRFSWYENGELKCSFDHDMPGDRRGKKPDSVLPMINAIGGFAPLDSDAEIAEEIHTTAAVMALVDWITGVRVTKALLEDSTYVAAQVVARQAHDNQNIMFFSSMIQVARAARGHRAEHRPASTSSRPRAGNA